MLASWLYNHDIHKVLSSALPMLQSALRARLRATKVILSANFRRRQLTSTCVLDPDSLSLDTLLTCSPPKPQALTATTHPALVCAPNCCSMAQRIFCKSVCLIVLAVVVAGAPTGPDTPHSFGNFDAGALSNLQIAWPPLRIVPYDPADHKLPRSIFLALSLPSKEKTVLKFCPLTINNKNRFVCENEARSHTHIASSTRCAPGTRCECSPHAIPIIASWKGAQIEQARFGMDVNESERNEIYRSMGLGNPEDRVVYMIMEWAPQIADLRELVGYNDLSSQERQTFARYILFQLAFTLYSLEKLGCSHRDIAQKRITHNIQFNQLADQSDPCNPRGNSTSCPWGYCWRASSRLWCFDREHTPLVNVIIRLYDFGSTTCKSPVDGQQWYDTEGLAAEKLRWDVRRGGVPDGGLLGRACGHHLGLPDCPRRFLRARKSVMDPYFKRFLHPGREAPEGACVFGTSWGH